MENIALNRERLKKKANLVLFFIFYEGGHVCLHLCHGAMQAMFVHIFAMTAAILNYETLKIAQLQKKHICVFSRESWIYGYLLPCREGANEEKDSL